MSRSSLRLAVGVGVAVLSVSVARGQTPLAPPMKDFVAAAAQSDHFEIVEGHTAVAQSHDPRVRAFAQQMIKAHTRTSEALQVAAMKAGMDRLPSGLNGDQQKMLTELQSQRGPEFNRTYLKQQYIAHDEALVLERAYAEGGDNVDVRQAAASAVPSSSAIWRWPSDFGVKWVALEGKSRKASLRRVA